MPSTERLTDEDRRGRAPPLRRWLARIGCAANPLAPPAIHPLDGLDRLVIGRDLDPEIGDPWMSSRHAELLREGETWTLRDLGSSNGTALWGAATTSALLSDGDVFETGGTFWRFCARPVEGALPVGPFDGPLASLCPELGATLGRVGRVARTRIPLMLLGPSGSGKEVLARHVHARSGRSGPFVAINTAAVQTSLVASELFGVERGAHSTAEQSRLGQVRRADGGTLLLDEIGDMPLEVQAALLRMLQEGEVVPVGGDRPVSVDVRVLCATHRDLDRLVAEGRFRADLYARLNGTVLELPALADRLEDIGLLIGRFLLRYDAPELTLSPSAYRVLLAWDWPLNVRELERALEAAVALCEGDRIERRHLPRAIQDARFEPAERAGHRPGADEPSDEEMRRLLALHQGNVSRVARALGRARSYVHRWLKQNGVDVEQFRV